MMLPTLLAEKQADREFLNNFIEMFKNPTHRILENMHMSMLIQRLISFYC